MASKLRMGFVGAGIVGVRDIFPNFARPEISQKLELAALCDIAEERVRQVAERFGAGAWYTDYEKMLAEADLDIVGVITPIPLHYLQAMAAIEAGKHVYVQKTMTSTFDEATRLVEAAKSRKVKLVASPGQILNPTIKALKEALAQGVIGKVCWGYGARGGSFHEHERLRGEPGIYNVDPTWYYKAGSGPIRDMAVYTLHTLVEFMGPAKRVTGFSGIAVPVRHWKGKRIDVEVDDNTTLVLDFGESRFVTLFSGFIGSMGGTHAELELHGDKGSLYYGFSYRPFQLVTSEGHPVTFGQAGTLKLDPPPRPSARESGASGRHIIADIMHLVECIKKDKAPIVSGERAAHVIEIIDKGYQSARCSRALELTSTF